jgi:hypothetical protein
MKLIPCLAILLIPFADRAAELPALVFPQGAGVNIHFVAGHERDLDMIAAAGLKFVRMDFHWAGIETGRGGYDWSAYDTLMNNLEQRGLRAMLTLDYSNPLYESEVTSTNPITHKPHKTIASPQHPESVAAFAQWAGEAARHFRGRRVIWEIWNEPNIQFWSPRPDAGQYTRLALATCNAIRKADPEATLVGPASSGFPWEFIETLFKAGALEFLDAVSVHPYRSYEFGPETAAADYSRLRQLIDRHAPASRKRAIPILSGEWGYATHRKGLALDLQAAFAVRQQLANTLQGIPLSIWYDWKNDGPDRDDAEHNFGLVDEHLEPKPAYKAVQVLTRELSGFSVCKRLPLDQPQDYVLLCTNRSGAVKLAAWTSGEAHAVGLKLQSAGRVQIEGAGGLGTAFVTDASDGVLNLNLAAMPQYLRLGTNRIVAARQE